jgi:hypothetical protein
MSSFGRVRKAQLMLCRCEPFQGYSRGCLDAQGAPGGPGSVECFVAEGGARLTYCPLVIGALL